MVKSISAIFFDRDGTINIDYGYVHNINKFKFIDGAIDAMRILKHMGYALIIVTNQSGIARGNFTEIEFKILTKWMNLFLANHGIILDGIYYCPHHPQGNIEQYRQICNCRKPHIGMLQLAQKYLHIDMANSVMVGDTLKDMQAAKNASIGTKILVRTGKPITSDIKNNADWIIDSIAVLPTTLAHRSNIICL